MDLSVKKTIYYLFLLTLFLLNGCSSSNTYPSIQEKYANKLALIHPGMSIDAVKQILPIRKKGASKDATIYALYDTAGTYQIFADKTTKIAGVSAEELPERRQMLFYFKNGKLEHWGK
jgi:hypothetical protein